MNLKAARLEKGLTMKEVAEKAGISESTYCLIENNHRNPSIKVARRLSHVLDVKWTDFFEENKGTT